MIAAANARAALVAALTLLAFVWIVAANTAKAAPLVRLTDYVVDAAGVMPADRKQALIQKLRAHEQATSNQVAVAVVPTLQGEALEEAALEILRTTGLGQADRNNGVLLLIAIEERKIRIEVGYGLEGALPDALAKTIIDREMAPRFRAGDLPGGIEAGVDGIIAAIQGEYEARPEDGYDYQNDPEWVPFLFVGLWMAIVGFMMWRKHERRKRRIAQGLPPGPMWYESDGGSGWSSGGGGFGGGGFGGGGGSGGGGGASGGW